MCIHWETRDLTLLSCVYREHIVKVKVFFEELAFEIITETPAYPVSIYNVKLEINISYALVICIEVHKEHGLMPPSVMCAGFRCKCTLYAHSRHTAVFAP